MDIMRTENQSGPVGIQDPTGRRIVIETDEHEEISLLAATDEELDAKLDDFLTWSS